MCVCEMANLLGCSVAITTMCTTKLERFDEIRTHGKRNFENEFLDGFSAFARNNYSLTKLEHWNVRATPKF